MSSRVLVLVFWVCAAFAAPPARPRLILGIVVDQFRYDYLTRFRTDYNSGFDRLLTRGAVFTNARYEHYPTVTAIGHATFMTGATPSLSGIIGNSWYDRETGKQVTSVDDASVQLLGRSNAAGASPRKLVVSTLGDEMKLAWLGKSKVIGMSLKDRSAILPAGHIADGAYWFDPQSGNFVSSTFYFKDLPQWARDFNASRRADRYLKAEWKPLAPRPDFPGFEKRMADTADPRYYDALEASPFGNELLEEFAERAIDAEKLGQDDITDLLTVSFSSNDYVGHEVGPDSPEVRDISIRTDRVIGKLLEFVDARVGLANVLVVFTGDHGVPQIPELLAERRMPAGRLSGKVILAAAEKALIERFGEGKWIAGSTGPAPYFDRALIRSRKLTEAEVQRVAADAVAQLPHMYRVYTREQLLYGQVLPDIVTRRVVNGFYPSRASDLTVLEEPYWIQAAHGTTHGSVFEYDAHVPLIFMGAGIRAGKYHARVMPNDIAPTLATLLEVETPSGSVGRVLTEMLDP
jgi:predicted AlkP superfamily pyrophosphatase or phosphodiesterase